MTDKFRKPLAAEGLSTEDKPHLAPEQSSLLTDKKNAASPITASTDEHESVAAAFAAEAMSVPLTPHELHREVWVLAWPSVMAMLLQTFNSMMDMFFVGHLPNAAQALAATGIGGSIMFLLISVAMGVTVGTTALVARFAGAGDDNLAIHATGQSMTLGFLLAVVFGTMAYFGRVGLVHLMLNAHQNPLAADYCIQFLGTALLGTIPLFLMNVFQAAFRGIGNTRTPMLITVAVITTHISFNWLLIYGHLGFPHLGVAGAGLAFTLSVWVGTLLFLVTLWRWSPLKEAVQWKHLKLRLEWAARILKIGIPAAIQAVIRTLSMLSFSGMLARSVEGAAGVAALQIGLRAEAIAFMPGFGYSVAASTLVGQSLGAKDPDRAERYGWAATWQGVVVMSCMAVFFFTLAVPLAGLFTNDPMVRQLGASYLRINAFSEPFLALGMVLTGALQGAGDTVRPTYLTILSMWVVRIPLAYWLMFQLHMNTHGAWYAVAASSAVGGLLTVGLFRSGKWKRIRV